MHTPFTSRTTRWLATLLGSALLVLLTFASPAKAGGTEREPLTEAAQALTTTSVFFSTDYPGQIRNNQLNDLRKHIDVLGEPVKVAFVPSSAANESGGQSGAAQLVLAELQTRVPSWQGSVAVVMPNVIITDSTTVPTHAALLQEAADHAGSDGNVAVLRDWVDRLHQSRQPPSHVLRNVISWIVGIIIGIVLAVIAFDQFQRASRRRQQKAEEFVAAGRAGRVEHLQSNVAIWRTANGRQPGSPFGPDPQIDSWLDECSDLLKQDADIPTLDRVSELLAQVETRHVEQLERPRPSIS